MLNFDPHRWIAGREGAKGVATVAAVASVHPVIEKSCSRESHATLATTATETARNHSASLSKWHAHLVRLNFDCAPDGFTLKRWRQLHSDSWWLYENFASRAVRHGWSEHDLFGVLPCHTGWGGWM